MNKAKVIGAVIALPAVSYVVTGQLLMGADTTRTPAQRLERLLKPKSAFEVAILAGAVVGAYMLAK